MPGCENKAVHLHSYFHMVVCHEHYESLNKDYNLSGNLDAGIENMPPPRGTPTNIVSRKMQKLKEVERIKNKKSFLDF